MTQLSQPRHFIFVGGLHRSGTGLIARLLAQHPDVSAMTNTGVSYDEGQFLQNVYLRDAQLGGAGQFAFDARAMAAPCADAAEAAAARARLVDGWSDYWDYSKRYLVEKSPGNCLNAGFLQSVFGADCSFVFITRHPMANAMATRKWSRSGLFALIEHWIHTHEQMRACFPRLRQAVWVTYEELTEQPQKTIDFIQHTLGMPRFAPDTSSVRRDNAGYFRDWHECYEARIRSMPDTIVRGDMHDPSPATRVKWRLRAQIRRALLRSGIDILSTGREASAVIAHYETRLRAIGYSLIDTGLRPAPPVGLEPGRASAFPELVDRRAGLKAVTPYVPTLATEHASREAALSFARSASAPL